MDIVGKDEKNDPQKVFKLIRKHWEQLELVQENIRINRTTHKEVEMFKTQSGTNLWKIEVIVRFQNHVTKEEPGNINIDHPCLATKNI